MDFEVSVLSFIFSAYLAGLSATLPPGPIFAVTAAEASRRGFLGGFMVVVGHAAVEVVVLIALTFGLGPLLSSGSVKIFVSVLGGLFLLWMGLGLVKDAYKGVVVRKKASKEDVSQYDSLVRGALAAVANPYFLIWWAVVGSAFVFRGMELVGLLGPVLFLLCHWASDFPWFSFVSFSVAEGRNRISDRAFRYLIGVCGISVLAIGVSFLVEGARLIRV